MRSFLMFTTPWRGSPGAIRDPQSTVQVLWQRESSHWSGFSWPHFRYLQVNAGSLAGLAANVGIEARIARADVIWDGKVGAVSANFFDLLGTGFVLGHGFSPEADNLGQPPAEVVLSYDTWGTYFAGGANVISEWIELNRHRLQVIGVAAPGFNGATINRTDMWVGGAWGDILRGERSINNENACCVSVVGRLKPGVGREAAQAELNIVHARYLASLSHPPRRLLLAAPSFLGNPTLSGQTFPIFLAMAVTALLILLLACANVANLQLARAVARRRENCIASFTRRYPSADSASTLGGELAY